MPKSIIKIIGNNGRIERFAIKPSKSVSINSKSFPDEEKSIIEINHDFEGSYTFYLNEREFKNILLPSVFLFNAKDSTLTKFYELSEYKYTVNLNYEFRGELNLITRQIHQLIKERYDDQIIIYDIEQEGSVKKNIILYGSLIYMGIANYGSFRAGLREIKKDLEWVGDKIESVFDNNSFEVSDKNTKIIYPKILSDEIEKLDNWRNYNSSTDEQQVMTKIQDLASLTLGEDRKIINQELNRMNIPLRIPNKKKRQIINRKYGILREEEKEIKTDANIA